ncbi:hypothetical protein ACFX15_028317 [Malus domestica]
MDDGCRSNSSFFKQRGSIHGRWQWVQTSVRIAGVMQSSSDDQGTSAMVRSDQRRTQSELFVLGFGLHQTSGCRAAAMVDAEAVW